jgi:hypothetical protein
MGTTSGLTLCFLPLGANIHPCRARRSRRRLHHQDTKTQRKGLKKAR